MLLAGQALAQDMEPRAYSNAPVGLNFLVAGGAFSRSAPSIESPLPVTDVRIHSSRALLAYSRVIDIWGMASKIDGVLPVGSLSASANFAHRPFEREASGLGDARIRLTVNFLGAPALSAAEFADYRQNLILGGSLQIALPTGQYASDRLVNLGSNRWSFKPELGASQAIGRRLTVELAAGTTFYTDNTNYNAGRTRAQAPLTAVRAHAILSLGAGVWASADINYYTGGRTTVDDVPRHDLQRNLRVGATLSVPLNASYSLRFSGSRSISARTGNNLDIIGIALQYRWGAGL
jgi:hypothetical protein